MRILLLTQWFEPEPIFKGLEFARELTALGHEVEVITGFPNYPGGKLYPGYKVKLIQKEVIDGITITRVPLFPSHDSSGLRRAVNYISFAVSSAVLGVFLIKRIDLAYVYHAPATIAFPAMIYKIILNIGFVYDINDLWPDTLSATNMINNKWLLSCVGYWCRLTYKMASHIVVITPGFKTKLLERGVPEDKISLIYNWCNESQLVALNEGAETSTDSLMAGRFNVVFAGTMGKAQGLNAVLEAASLILPIIPKIQFVFVGDGIELENLKKMKSAMGLDNVLFLPRRPMAEIGKLLVKADLLLVHLKDEPLFEITLPSKTQAYMAAGRPILMAVKGDAANLVESANAGMSCMPGNPGSIKDTLEELYHLPVEELEKMGANGKKYYEQELSIKNGVRRFDRIFKSTMEGSV